MSNAPKVFSIPSSAPFAETLAKGLIERHGDAPLALADIAIYLPTRRAARTFGDAFARVMGGAALLPSFRPLGDVDEDELLFDPAADALDLPQAINPLRRKLLLATLVRRWCAAERGEDLTFTQAVAFADSLSSLLDEIQTHSADWTELDTVVPAALAQHWSEVRGFLLLLKDQWPELLRAESAVDPATRRNLALRALENRLRDSEPRPVIAAGSTGSIPATADLLRTIAHLPLGAVVLPGLDRDLDETGWAGVSDDPAHPQFGLKQLLDHIGVAREDVGEWSTVETNRARETLLSTCLRPAPTTDAWRAIAEGDTATIQRGLEGLSVLKAADPNEEASAIALILREALDTLERTAALVTPDRALARRVAAELGRWNIDIDDSAGQPLAHTAPGTFLGLVAECLDAKFAPVPLLAMLKHPLTSAGADAAEFRRHARTLDRILRGPRPDPGIDGIANVIPSGDPVLGRWFDRIAAILRPFVELMEMPLAPIAALVQAHAQAAQSLSDDSEGIHQLWRGEAGDAAQTLIAGLIEASADLPTIEPASYAPLFRTLTEGVAVRPPYGRHPRLAILGPREARLQGFDVVILGGLNEGTWPRATAADPWLSRPMRQAIGLESPERAIGLAAHDFATLAAQPRVIATRALKSEGTPTVASRWLQRIEQFASGLKLDAALDGANAYIGIARALDDAGPAKRTKRPAPTPPVALRPRKLSITEIEKWRRDPYAIYARRILDLKPLDLLDAEVGPLERGSIVHKALELFVLEFPDVLPERAVGRLIEIADSLFQAQKLSKAILAIWRPRFVHAAHWFVAEERTRRERIAESHVEVDGSLTVTGPAGAFLLYGRADRIDILKSGGASIIDYKTGAPPSGKQVKALLNPQLPMEAAIVAAGGVPDIGKREPVELLYVKFSGGREPGKFVPVDVNAAAIADQAAAWLEIQVARFDEQNTAYLSRALTFRRAFAGDYDHLARVDEWSDEPEEDDE